MAVGSLFSLYAVLVDTTLIDQITDLSMAAELDEILLNAGGEVFNRFVATGTRQEVVNFSSNAIATALGTVALAGKKVESGHVVDCFFQKYAEGGAREGATAHPKIVVNKGIVIPTGINVENDQVAQMGISIIATYDGSNDPLKYTADQSLGGSPNADEAFTVGPVKLNGTTITGVQGIQINPGVQVVALGGDGEGHVTFVAIRRVQPSIMFRFVDVAAALASVKFAGEAQGATDSVVYLRKMAAGGARVSDVTEEHISFTMDEGRYQLTELSGSEGGEVVAAGQYTPVYDGTNDPFVISVAAAIV